MHTRRLRALDTSSILALLLALTLEKFAISLQHRSGRVRGEGGNAEARKRPMQEGVDRGGLDKRKL